MNDTVSPADRRQWQAARSFGDVARLTALRLEGAIGSRPGYMPGRGPGAETGRLVPALAALCRAGYLTIASRPGNGWEQRAAVEGLCSAEVADRISRAGETAGLTVIAHAPADRPNWCWGPSGRSITVTRAGGRADREFGPRLSCGQIGDRRAGWGMCHPDAVAALCGAWQVTVADPQWGRPEVLWRALAGLAGTSSSRRATNLMRRDI